MVSIYLRLPACWALQGGSIPRRCNGGGFIGALEEFENEGIWATCRSDIPIGQQKFAQAVMPERLGRSNILR